MKKLCFSRSLRVIKSIKSIKVVFTLFLSSIVLERTNENRKQLKRPKINKKNKGAKINPSFKQGLSFRSKLVMLE